MKTVLFLGFSNKIGLTYHFVDWVISLAEIANNKLKIILVTLKNEQNPGLHKKLRENCQLDVVTLNSLGELKSIESLTEADIVHCQGFKQVAKMLKIKRVNELRFKIIATIHAFRNGTWYKPIYTNLVSCFCNKIDAIHFLSHASKDEFLQWNLLYNRSNSSFVFPLGCNEAEFLKDEHIEDLDFYKELSESKKNIVYLAEFTRGKQHKWLLKTIGDTLIKENACLWLFGGESGEKKKVIEYINKKGLSQNVKLPGRVDRKYVPSLLKWMNFAVCTSKSETFGHVIMEPMFAGIPVVTFNIGTASYLIRDFTNGFVIKNKSEQENFKKAVEFLLRNKDAAEVMGRNNKEMANKWLTWEAMCNNSVNMYLAL